MNKLRAMNTFVGIVDGGSLTAAAEAGGKSLPSVVRSLATLEDSLGVRLLNRTTRRIALTDEGRLYLEHCRQILADVEDAERAMSQDQAEPKGVVRVTAPVLFGNMHVAPAVTRFLKRYQQTQVELALLDRVINMTEEGVDVAVRISHLHDSSMIAIPVGEIRRVVCASPSLLRKMPRPKRPQDLADLDCVRFTGIASESSWSFSVNGKSVAVPVKGCFQCNQAAAAIDACVAGLGIGMFLSYQVAPWVKAGQLKILLADFELAPIPVSLVYSSARLMTSRVRVFLDWMTRGLRGAL